MYSVVRSVNRLFHSVSYFSNIIDQCLLRRTPSKSLKSAHAQLIKFALDTNTFLSNRCVDIYWKYGDPLDAVMLFHENPHKNIVSWNLYLKISLKCLDIQSAHKVFDEMPEKDTVSWNTIISGYISSGFSDKAWGIFLDMQGNGVRPSSFTFSILFSCVKCVNYAKEMHCFMMRNDVDNLSLVVGNSLIDVYGRLGHVDYAIAVFFVMGQVDVISWNSLISCCCKSGFEEYGLHQFSLMGSKGYNPDAYTVSSVLNACSTLCNLEKGRQIFSLCLKMGFLSNTIVSSAAIDMFSKCNRMENAMSIFENLSVIDSALSNSMIACYASHGMEEKAMELFVRSLKENIRPTEYTLSSVLSASAEFFPAELGTQSHSLVIKLGFDLDGVVASSLMEMYCKYGLIESAVIVFDNMGVKDLIAWNTMLLGLTNNGKLAETICLFQKLLQIDFHLDQITFSAVLLACCYGGSVDEGMSIFSSMENRHGIKPMNEHYACVAQMMSRAGKITEALKFLRIMQCVPDAFTCELSLDACKRYENLELIETVAERLIELKANSLLPCIILAKAYEKRGRWESLVRIRKEMKKMTTEKEVDCSSVGIRGHTFSFEGEQIVHDGGKDVYSVLQLLAHEMCDEIDDQSVVNCKLTAEYKQI